MLLWVAADARSHVAATVAPRRCVPRRHPCSPSPTRCAPAGEPRIRDDRDPALTELAAAAAEARAAVDALFADCRESWGDLGADLRCEYERAKGGFVFRASKKHDKAVRALPGVEVLSVLKDGFHFTTGAKGAGGGLKRLSADLADADAEYAAASRAVIESTLAAARGFCPLLEAAGGLLAELDAVAAMASMVAGMPGCWVRPTMTEAGTGDVVIRGARPRRGGTCMDRRSVGEGYLGLRKSVVDCARSDIPSRYHKPVL